MNKIKNFETKEENYLINMKKLQDEKLSLEQEIKSFESNNSNKITNVKLLEEKVKLL